MLRSTQQVRIVPEIVRCFVLSAFALAVVAAPRAAIAQSCQWTPEGTPAAPAPSALWNGLEPTETTIPSCQTQGCASRDTSWFNTNGGYGLHNPYFESFDIEQGTLFAVTNLALQVWNLNTPAVPTRISQIDIRALAPELNFQPHDYFIPTDLDAPDGNGDLLAVTGRNSMGMLMLSTAASPTPIYQDSGPGSGQKVGTEVYAGRIGSRDYAFLAVKGSPTYSGVWAYDMTAAQQLSTHPCVETRPTEANPQCNGVFKSRLSTEDVAHIDGAGNFVVFSGGLASFTFKGFEIWNVANPGSPFQVHSGLTNDRVDGVALWQQGSKYYLALHNRDALQGQIYDVTCIATNSCGGLSLKYSFPLVGFSNFGAAGTVTDSVSNGTNFVYFGGRFWNSMTGLQEEWLFDTTALNQNQDPQEITGGDPQNGNLGQPTIVVDGQTVGYWSYYYMCNPTGTNLYRPNMGKFGGGSYFYRAGNSIFDVHRRRSVGPVINVSGPATGFTGQDLQFTASALNCTPSSSGWSWTPGSGGTVISGGTTASATIRWSTTGTKSVTASNSQCGGAAQNPAAISIVSAAPAVGSVTRTPASAPVCTPITFTANSVSGQPPLAYSWDVLQSSNPIPSSACSGTTPGQTFCWDTTAASPGSYQGRVTVSGPGGPNATATSAAVTLTALPALPVPGFVISNDPFTAGTVQFHSSVAGATEWRWDFGDGTVLETTDPALGPDPMHSYSAIGGYDVTLEVRNCQNPTYIASQVLPIQIDQISPLLITTFQAVCPFGQCSFNVGGTITFTTVVSGDPDFYEYDWNGTGNFVSSSTPVTTHAYTSVGTYSPVLRLRRGTETVSHTHTPPIQVTTGTPPPTPSISVSGSSTATVGQSRTYTASASNCSPSVNGWTWTTTGGTGTSTTSSISVSWASAGTKVVRATNSACGTASGSKTVTVTSSTPGPSPFAAAFSFTPSAPEAGQEVSFNASPSTGNPTAWTWAFGDGSAGSGQQATHAYSQPGNYSAQLTITKTEAGCGSFGQNVCSDTITETVEVTGSSGVCVPDSETICLQDGRFQVTAHWRDQRTGSQGNAKVYTPYSSNKTGMFWFFRPDNVELIVKALDGTTVNGNYWFFYGGLSDVEYWIDVVDTETEASNEYHNEPGSICGFPDTGAFPVAGGGAEATSSGTWSSAGLPAAGDGIGSQSAAVEGTCSRGGNNLCLLDNRFSLEVDWHDQHSGDSGVGTPVIGTDRTGYFWFFNSQNIELVAKMIDASDPFGYFWVLWGGLSDVEYTLRVTDTVTELEKEYHNPPGSFCGGADTVAFESE